MIKHSNLLDKVWYVKNNQISEVTNLYYDIKTLINHLKEQ